MLRYELGVESRHIQLFGLSLDGQGMVQAFLLPCLRLLQVMARSLRTVRWLGLMTHILDTSLSLLYGSTVLSFIPPSPGQDIIGRESTVYLCTVDTTCDQTVDKKVFLCSPARPTSWNAMGTRLIIRITSRGASRRVHIFL